MMVLVARTVLLTFMRFMLSDSVPSFYFLLPYLSCVYVNLCSEFILLVY